MQINSRTRMSDLLYTYPEAREILTWYEVDLDEGDMTLDLGLICSCYGLDFEDVRAELELMLDDGLQMSGDYNDEEDDYSEDSIFD
ncbi:MAG: hypothetical protein P8R54_13720 [Myxococcota bacterium]|nr:hypothetical protein [Myxococcota bacterium]